MDSRSAQGEKQQYQKISREEAQALYELGIFGFEWRWCSRYGPAFP